MNYLQKISYHLSLIAIVLFTLLASYFRGLFFDSDIYLFELIVGIIFLLYFFVYIKGNIHIFSQPYIWLISLITFIYFIHTFIADNQLYAYQELFRWVMVTQLFILVVLIKDKSNKVYHFVLYSIIGMGVWTSIFGWLAAYDLVDFKAAFLSNRISSVFQYPNTFGAIVAALLIGILVKTTSTNWKYSLLSLTSYLFTITLIFTYSRGAWLVAALFLLLCLFFLNLRQQILYLAHLLVIGLAVIITLAPISASIVDKDFSRGFLIIGLATIISAMVYVIFSLILSKVNFKLGKNIFRWIIPVLAIVILIAGYSVILSPEVVERLPDTIKNRLASINLETKSVVERNNFYKDATKMIMDQPLFGHGGGAWKEKFESYQSYPYTSREVHNFYYQLPVEIGIVGLLLFIAFIAIIVWSIIKRRNKDEEEYNKLLAIGFIVIFLLVHSFIDFNMSYAYVLGLVMILLGLIAEPLKWNFKKDLIFKVTSIIIIIILSIMSLVITARFFSAENSIKKLGSLKQTDQIIRGLDYVISLNPYNLDYRLVKINYYKKLYSLGPSEEYKTNILKEANYLRDTKSKNPTMILTLSQIYGELGYLIDSIDLLEHGIANNYWEDKLYSQYAAIAVKLADYYKRNNELEKYQENIERVFWAYDEMVEKRKYLDLQVASLRYVTFQPSLDIELAVGKAYILEGQYIEGIEQLTPITTDKYIAIKVRYISAYPSEQKIVIKNEAAAWIAFAYNMLDNQEKVDEFINIGVSEDVSKLYIDLINKWE